MPAASWSPLRSASSLSDLTAPFATPSCSVPIIDIIDATAELIGGKPMMNEELIVQLIGRVATLEHLMSQTMVLALLDHPSPVEVVSVFEESFEGAVGDLEAVLPEAAPAAVEAAERIFSRVRNELG